MSTPVAPFEIVKVVDTRDFMEIDDRWVALAGSGEARECDRCDRVHEVHAHVIDANGLSFVVGTGCMDATKSEASKAARGATNAARKAARREAAAALAAELAAAEATVAALVFPADRVESGMDAAVTGTARWFWTVDGASAYWFPYTDGEGPDAAKVAERLGCVEDNWRRDRLHEILPRETVNKARREADWLERNPA